MGGGESKRIDRVVGRGGEKVGRVGEGGEGGGETFFLGEKLDKGLFYIFEY